MIHKVRINKKYPFKQMSPGETFKLNELDVRGAQKLAYYYRSLCKRPIQVVVTKRDDGYYCSCLGDPEKTRHGGRGLVCVFQKTVTRSKPQPSARARGGLLTFFEKRAHRCMVFFSVNTLHVFLVNPSIVVPPTQNRAPQQAACD